MNGRDVLRLARSRPRRNVEAPPPAEGEAVIQSAHDGGAAGAKLRALQREMDERMDLLSPRSKRGGSGEEGGLRQPPPRRGPGAREGDRASLGASTVSASQVTEVDPLPVQAQAGPADFRIDIRQFALLLLQQLGAVGVQHLEEVVRGQGERGIDGRGFVLGALKCLAHAATTYGSCSYPWVRKAGVASDGQMVYSDLDIVAGDGAASNGKSKRKPRQSVFARSRRASLAPPSDEVGREDAAVVTSAGIASTKGSGEERLDFLPDLIRMHGGVYLRGSDQFPFFVRSSGHVVVARETVLGQYLQHVLAKELATSRLGTAGVGPASASDVGAAVPLVNPLTVPLLLPCALLMLFHEFDAFSANAVLWETMAAYWSNVGNRQNSGVVKTKQAQQQRKLLKAVSGGRVAVETTTASSHAGRLLAELLDARSVQSKPRAVAAAEASIPPLLPTAATQIKTWGPRSSDAADSERYIPYAVHSVASPNTNCVVVATSDSDVLFLDASSMALRGTLPMICSLISPGRPGSSAPGGSVEMAADAYNRTAGSHKLNRTGDQALSSAPVQTLAGSAFITALEHFVMPLPASERMVETDTKARRRFALPTGDATDKEATSSDEDRDTSDDDGYSDNLWSARRSGRKKASGAATERVLGSEFAGAEGVIAVGGADCHLRLYHYTDNNLSTARLSYLYPFGTPQTTLKYIPELNCLLAGARSGCITRLTSTTSSAALAEASILESRGQEYIVSTSFAEEYRLRVRATVDRLYKNVPRDRLGLWDAASGLSSAIPDPLRLSDELAFFERHLSERFTNTMLQRQLDTARAAGRGGEAPLLTWSAQPVQFDLRAPVTDIVLLSTKGILGASTSTGVVSFYDADTFEPHDAYRTLRFGSIEAPVGIFSLAHSPDFEVVACGGTLGTPFLTIPGASPVPLYDGGDTHADTICSVEFVRGSAMFVSADVGGVVKVWDVRRMQCVETVRACADGAASYQRTVGWLDGIERQRRMANVIGKHQGKTDGAGVARPGTACTDTTSVGLWERHNTMKASPALRNLHRKKAAEALKRNAVASEQHIRQSDEAAVGPPASTSVSLQADHATIRRPLRNITCLFVNYYSGTLDVIGARSSQRFDHRWITGHRLKITRGAPQRQPSAPEHLAQMQQRLTHMSTAALSQSATQAEPAAANPIVCMTVATIPPAAVHAAVEVTARRRTHLIVSDQFDLVGKTPSVAEFAAAVRSVEGLPRKKILLALDGSALDDDVRDVPRPRAARVPMPEFLRAPFELIVGVTNGELLAWNVRTGEMCLHGGPLAVCSLHRDHLQQVHEQHQSTTRQRDQRLAHYMAALSEQDASSGAAVAALLRAVGPPPRTPSYYEPPADFNRNRYSRSSRGVAAFYDRTVEMTSCEVFFTGRRGDSHVGSGVSPFSVPDNAWDPNEDVVIILHAGTTCGRVVEIVLTVECACDDGTAPAGRPLAHGPHCVLRCDTLAERFPITTVLRPKDFFVDDEVQLRRQVRKQEKYIRALRQSAPGGPGAGPSGDSFASAATAGSTTPPETPQNDSLSFDTSAARKRRQSPEAKAHRRREESKRAAREAGREERARLRAAVLLQYTKDAVTAQEALQNTDLIEVTSVQRAVFGPAFETPPLERAQRLAEVAATVNRMRASAEADAPPEDPEAAARALEALIYERPHRDSIGLTLYSGVFPMLLTEQRGGEEHYFRDILLNDASSGDEDGEDTAPEDPKPSSSSAHDGSSDDGDDLAEVGALPREAPLFRQHRRQVLYQEKVFAPVLRAGGALEARSTMPSDAGSNTGGDGCLYCLFATSMNTKVFIVLRREPLQVRSHRRERRLAAVPLKERRDHRRRSLFGGGYTAVQTAFRGPGIEARPVFQWVRARIDVIRSMPDFADATRAWYVPCGGAHTVLTADTSGGVHWTAFPNMPPVRLDVGIDTGDERPASPPDTHGWSPTCLARFFMPMLPADASPPMCIGAAALARERLAGVDPQRPLARPADGSGEVRFERHDDYLCLVARNGLVALYDTAVLAAKLFPNGDPVVAAEDPARAPEAVRTYTTPLDTYPTPLLPVTLTDMERDALRRFGGGAEGHVVTLLRSFPLQLHGQPQLAPAPPPMVLCFRAGPAVASQHFAVTAFSHLAACRLLVFAASELVDGSRLATHVYTHTYSGAVRSCIPISAYLLGTHVDSVRPALLGAAGGSTRRLPAALIHNGQRAELVACGLDEAAVMRAVHASGAETGPDAARSVELSQALQRHRADKQRQLRMRERLFWVARVRFAAPPECSDLAAAFDDRATRRPTFAVSSAPSQTTGWSALRESVAPRSTALSSGPRDADAVTTVDREESGVPNTIIGDASPDDGAHPDDGEGSESGQGGALRVYARAFGVLQKGVPALPVTRRAQSAGGGSRRAGPAGRLVDVLYESGLPEHERRRVVHDADPAERWRRTSLDHALSGIVRACIHDGPSRAGSLVEAADTIVAVDPPWPGGSPAGPTPQRRGLHHPVPQRTVTTGSTQRRPFQPRDGLLLQAVEAQAEPLPPPPSAGTAVAHRISHRARGPLASAHIHRDEPTPQERALRAVLHEHSRDTGRPQSADVPRQSATHETRRLLARSTGTGHVLRSEKM